MTVKQKEYRLKSTGKGADYYGDCERCGQTCSLHYMQQSRNVGSQGWTTYGFGHAECLRTGPWESAL